MTHEQVAFAFIRELQKRFGKTAVLSDIEMSQEQGWTHAVVDVCDAYRAAHEPRATRGYLGSTPDGSIDDADRVLEDAIPLMPDDVANKITDLVLSDGIAYVLYKADELPVVLRRQDITENRQEHALQALADQAQALAMGYDHDVPPHLMRQGYRSGGVRDPASTAHPRCMHPVACMKGPDGYCAPCHANTSL
jgi:hypothetical protein